MLGTEPVLQSLHIHLTQRGNYDKPTLIESQDPAAGQAAARTFASNLPVAGLVNGRPALGGAFSARFSGEVVLPVGAWAPGPTGNVRL